MDLSSCKIKSNVGSRRSAEGRGKQVVPF